MNELKEQNPVIISGMKQSLFFLSFLILISCCKRDDIEENSFVELYRFREAGNGKYGYMDKFDQVVIRPKYIDARQFNDGFAAVNLNNRWGFINTNDSVIIPTVYDWVSSFGEFGLKNIAIVKNNIQPYRVPTNMGGKMGFINKNGELITPMDFKNFKTSFKGIMPITNQDDKWGLISIMAEEIIPCEYDSIFYNFNSDTISMYKKGINYRFSINEITKKKYIP